MYQKISTDQIQSMTLKDLKETRRTLQQAKAALTKEKDVALVWPDDKEQEFQDVLTNLNDVNVRIKELEGFTPKKDEGVTAAEPKVKAGKNHDFVVVKAYPAGVRFDANTGKQILFPEEVTMSLSEWRLFKMHHKSLGYSITEVINDPTGEAEEFIEK